MKSAPILLTAGLALSACSAANTTASKLLTKSSADFAQANKIALAATPPDQVGATCWQYLQTNLTALQGAVATAQQLAPVGPASLLETASVANDRVMGLLSPEQKDAFYLGCGPEIAKLTGDANALGALLAAILPK